MVKPVDPVAFEAPVLGVRREGCLPLKDQTGAVFFFWVFFGSASDDKSGCDAMETNPQLNLYLFWGKLLEG